MKACRFYSWLSPSKQPLLALFVMPVLFWSNSIIAQNRANEMHSLDAIIDILDKKVYEVPGYGFIRFRFNRADFKAENEVPTGTGCPTDLLEFATFDVNIKGVGDRAYDRVDYKLKLPYPVNGEYRFTDPNEIYSRGFSFENMINFPCTFLLFGNGQLYFKLQVFKKMPFDEFKSMILGESKAFDLFMNSGYEFVWTECKLSEDQD